MKKFVSIITGILIGSAASYGVVVSSADQVAHGALNLWDKAVAQGDLFDWNTVFRSDVPKDLYQLIYYKNLVKPASDGLKEVASKYGLTRDEAQKVIDGSIIPLVNNPNQRSVQLTQDDAFVLAANAKRDYEFFLEAYKLQQEIDSSIKTNEIFANGDLSDSGFDLINDLEQIETVLFEAIEKNLVGGPFGNQLSSPFLPTNNDAANTDFVSSDNPADVLKLNFGVETVETGVVRSSSEESSTGTKGSLDLGEGKSVPVEILSGDVCVADVSGNEVVGSELGGALNDYEERKSAAGSGAAGNTDGVPSKEKFKAKDSETAKKLGGPQTGGEISPAKADEWLSQWCPNLTSKPAGDDGTGFGVTGFSSLSDVPSELIDASAGAYSGVDSENFKAVVSICLSTELVTKSVSSYQPGQSCVLCELEKINANFKKTLSHSLVPNKVAGNLMESAKCKDAYDTSLLDMKVVTIASPVPAPSREEAIYGRNVFDQWKQFVDSYKPFVLDKVKVDNLVKRQTKTAPEGVTQEDVLSAIDKTLAKASAEAKAEIDNYKVANKGLNNVLYGQTVLAQLREMRSYFETYREIYKKTAAVCKDIGNKKYIN